MMFGQSSRPSVRETISGSSALSTGNIGPKGLMRLQLSCKSHLVNNFCFSSLDNIKISTREQDNDLWRFLPGCRPRRLRLSLSYPLEPEEEDQIIEIVPSLLSFKVKFLGSMVYPNICAFVQRLAQTSALLKEAEILWDPQDTPSLYKEVMESMIPMLPRLQSLTIRPVERSISAAFDLIASNAPQLKTLDMSSYLDGLLLSVTLLSEVATALQKLTRLETLVLPRVFPELLVCDDFIEAMNETFEDSTFRTFQRSLDEFCELLPPQLRNTVGVFSSLEAFNTDAYPLLATLLLLCEEGPHGAFLLDRISKVGLVNSFYRNANDSVLCEALRDSSCHWMIPRLLDAGADPFVTIGPAGFEEGTPLNLALASSDETTFLKEIMSRYDAQSIMARSTL
eukprot:TRINITY_DN1975_c0_g1_i2.p1 TRINITY_DN1975_c0_g1~~TRINITY_DN1975_c0_g1_i2.p1  ORF type:complete len:396 (+),score=52.22 TRINITY_DN1975_c0_g1_i2:325-1512(+)